ncbi:hypothetical protein ACJRO7_007577 [Eucalyptus globulus]|uniref:Uncharacterized protein n=1 Tax=Eucalyptus globulus TaxID=34317 RepID=A0ABD3INC1_EUCGL
MRMRKQLLRASSNPKLIRRIWVLDQEPISITNPSWVRALMCSNQREEQQQQQQQQRKLMEAGKLLKKQHPQQLKEEAPDQRREQSEKDEDFRGRQA